MELEIELAQEILLSLQWDDVLYSKSLDEFLKHHKITSVLDVCGGTGFPALQLAKMGWDITYADGSEKMRELFMNKSRSLGLEISAYQCDWINLSSIIQKRFDFVLCRGNSLVYIDTWNGGAVSDETPNHLLRALHEFYMMLNSGGILYVDLYKEDKQGSLNWRKNFSWVSQDEEVFDCVSILNVLPEYKKRKWCFEIKSDRISASLERESFLLSQIQLRDLLFKAGFECIQPVTISGEDIFNIFVARKA
jgi:SAM-dependent methyltransferase